MKNGKRLKQIMKWTTPIIALLPLICFSACSTVKYVPVESVRTDTLQVADRMLIHDSVYVRDSVLVMIKGDTVRIDRIKYIYKDKLRTDTLVLTQIKTQREQVPVTIEKPLTPWQRFRLRAFWWLAAALLAVGAWRGRKQIVKLFSLL